MSQALGRICRSAKSFIELPGIRYRWKQHSKGKDPRIAQNLAQKMAEWNAQDPAVDFKVDISYPTSKNDRKIQLSERLEHRRQIKENYEIQKAAKNRTLNPSLDDINQDWIITAGRRHIKAAADYYGVYDDLFENGYFLPITPLEINYKYILDDQFISSVHRGNHLKSYEAASAPSVSYDADENERFTLVLTTPDCHLTEENGEYLHWLIGNIPGNRLSDGEELCDYLQPFPPRGIGFCRYIFVLYKQEKVIDLSKYRRKSPCTNLTARTFSTYDFYREFEDDITPVGLAFFQCDWDQSLTNFFQNVLDMPEPIFEYDFDKKVLKPQQWFPKSEPFNLYMDKYKDPKQLQKELLLEKLKERHPFKPPPKAPKYPLAYHISTVLPSWLKDDIRRKRMREGKWKYM